MRIITLNTWKNEGDYPRRLAAMAAGLSALAPDIVLLQEAFRTLDDEAHTARTLADALRLEFVYAPARLKARRWHDRIVPSESGLAILARGAFAWSERLSLPSDELGGERMALLAKAIINGAPVVAGCLHLSHVRGDHARRREQLETVLTHPVWHSSAALRLLGGDCNATLDAPALAWIDQHPTLAIHAILSASDAPPTHPLPRTPARPGRTIDHLFCVTAPTEPPIEIDTAGIALAAAIDGVFPSDHAAVVADLRVRSPRSSKVHESSPSGLCSQSDLSWRGRIEGVPARAR